MLTRLVFLSPAREQPSPWLVVDTAGLIVSRGALAIDGSAAPFRGRTILIVPGTHVVTRWLALGEGSPARVAEGAAMRLKDEIGAPRDSVHIAVGEVEDDSSWPVSVVDRGLMREFLDRAAELRISPDVVIPDHLMLPAPEDGVLAVAVNGIVAVRGAEIAFSAEHELAAILIGTRRQIWIKHDPDIEQLFTAASGHIEMNLLQQEFAPDRCGRKRRHWRAVALAAIAALSPLVLWGAEIARNEISADALVMHAEASARNVLGAAGLGDPIGELRSRLAGVDANDSFMRATAALFEAMSRIEAVELENLSYLADGVIRARLMHGVRFDVNALNNALAGSGIEMDQDAPVERDGQMITVITLKRQP